MRPVVTGSVPVRTTKGERTRARIVDAALELFLAQGYEGTTMRQVAERAGVSVGNAYYYFSSKEHLVQGFYARTDDEHRAAVQPLLAEQSSLRGRLAAVVRSKVETAAPYHRFAGILFKTAADPQSPLNPFSEQSAEVSAVALMEEVVAGSDTKVHKDLRAELPNLLWLYEMAVILFWIHDESPGFQRTHRLIDHTVGLIARLLGLANLPLMGPLRKRTLSLLDDLRPVPVTDDAGG
jgi:AcrR family transcriptional regulator